MTHTYHIDGMTCGSCETKVKSSLLVVQDITSVEVSKAQQSATISMNRHIPLPVLQKALDQKYTISTSGHSETTEEVKSWFSTYKPLLLIAAYISCVALLAALQQGTFSGMYAMRIFMAGFFLTFSFFKMLNLSGFAESYAMYDLVAMRFKSWGYVYAFIELGLGLAYASGSAPLPTNIITLIVLSVSLAGVLKSVWNKQKIRCACLGAVFNLPMSSVTIIEDALMIAMSGIMIFLLSV